MNNNQFELQISNYDGPLELLLQLVKNKKMDIFSINLEELANAYLESINKYKEEDIDIASEYLLMAATLLQLKSKMLLEDPDEKKTVNLTKTRLIKQLAEYQQFKNIGNKLKTKELERQGLFIKESEDYSSYERPVDPSKLDGSSNSTKLIMNLRKMFERTNAQNLRVGTIKQVNISPEKRQKEIRELLKTKKILSFEEVFNVPSLGHFAVTLLAILDMSRLQEIIIKQDEQFGDIEIIKRSENE